MKTSHFPSMHTPSQF